MSAWFLVGSLAIKPEGANRNYNRSYLLAPDGAVAARYDKIHLFDVDLPSGETYRERSEEHTSELQSLMRISYAVFCLKKKKTYEHNDTYQTRLAHTITH